MLIVDKEIETYYEEIQNLYLADNNPWIIGYSGGKDSTATLQLVWEALSKLSKEKLNKKVFIVSSDTLIEIPKVLNIVDKNIQKINHVAKIQNLPFEAIKVYPDINDSFWVNLIGKGYPAPTSNFRWCTDRLKIDPVNNFILNTANKHGEVIVVIGVRKSESAQRKKTIENHSIKNSLLSKHPSLPGAHVYKPISELGVKDVWDYLLNSPSPWAGNNIELLRLYRRANAGECPLIIDKTDKNAPSCGNSRFGCWICTVVQNEKSLSSLIDNGEKWLKPLSEYREFLMETLNPDKKHNYRDYKRRDGSIYFLNNQNEEQNKKLGRGPYYFWFRQYMLEKLFETEILLNEGYFNKFGQNRKDLVPIKLISEEELLEIQRLWKVEEHDWEDSLNKIYKKFYGKNFDNNSNSVIFDNKDYELIEELSDFYSIDPKLIAKLINYLYMNNNIYGKNKLVSGLEKILNEEWRSEKEIIEEANN